VAFRRGPGAITGKKRFLTLRLPEGALTALLSGLGRSEPNGFVQKAVRGKRREGNAMKIPYTVALVAALLAVDAGTAMAGMSPGDVDTRRQQAQGSSETIGDQLARGELTEQQVAQLIQFTGLTMDSAKAYTVPEVVAMRWTNN
jgi:hypothetical protein